jgi:hypothetical protein
MSTQIEHIEHIEHIEYIKYDENSKKNENDNQPVEKTIDNRVNAHLKKAEMKHPINCPCYECIQKQYSPEQLMSFRMSKRASVD